MTDVGTDLIIKLLIDIPELENLRTEFIDDEAFPYTYSAAAWLAEVLRMAFGVETSDYVKSQLPPGCGSGDGDLDRLVAVIEGWATHPDVGISRDLLGAGLFEALDGDELELLAPHAGPATWAALKRMEYYRFGGRPQPGRQATNSEVWLAAIADRETFPRTLRREDVVRVLANVEYCREQHGRGVARLWVTVPAVRRFAALVDQLTGGSVHPSIGTIPESLAHEAQTLCFRGLDAFARDTTPGVPDLLDEHFFGHFDAAGLERLAPHLGPLAWFMLTRLRSDQFGARRQPKVKDNSH